MHNNAINLELSTFVEQAFNKAAINRFSLSIELSCIQGFIGQKPFNYITGQWQPNEELSIDKSLIFNNEIIGKIKIPASECLNNYEYQARTLDHIIDSLLLIIKEYQKKFSVPSSNQFNLSWIGQSRAITDIQNRAYKYANVNFPVLIHGKRGTGKFIAAYSIHQLGARKSQPFVEACAIQWVNENPVKIMKELCQQASGGTLFIRNINSLPNESLKQIRHYWESIYLDTKPEVRIICSTSPDHDLQSINDSTAPWLLLELPNLQQRVTDIELLVQYFCTKYQGISKLEFADCALQLLNQYAWVENVKELESMIVTLAVNLDSTKLTKASLIKVFPKLTQVTEPLVLRHLQQQTCEPMLAGHAQNQSLELAFSILESENIINSIEHPAVSKSLRYLKSNYLNKLSIEKIAKDNYISPQHLSHLYKKNLKISIKQLIVHLRIAKAIELLNSVPKKNVTSISYEVGFHDLSHFEKSFKKVTNKTPSQYLAS
ncbi:AraC family transcriptional regulator [Paraferrimonas sp. SM1919]|uniref:AraC family transcriptional regulator n=1 Tax=Paraferrimonas sp. SM1919 TaxID=2662263 RepID=UPI0013D2FA6F|nr:AraC family transcriptional regulator [Paraferrimonas sp. SM1919]